MMDRERIAALTHEYGGDWGVEHSRRLLHLVEMIGDGLEYDPEVVWLAAYLHDWGGYQAWAVEGIEHQIRSKQVAETFLNDNGYGADTVRRVLECIEFHHGGDDDRSIEAILLSDADALDLMGVVGTLRIFSMLPRDLRSACIAVRRWRDKSLGVIRLDRSKAIAEQRSADADRLLRQFEEETFGCF